MSSWFEPASTTSASAVAQAAPSAPPSDRAEFHERWSLLSRSQKIWASIWTSAIAIPPRRSASTNALGGSDKFVPPTEC